MDERHAVEFDGVWTGLSTLLVAILAFGVFVFTTEPVDTGGVIASVALAAVGVAQLLAPRVSPWFVRLSPRWTGLFWILAGVGVATLGVVASPTVGKLGGGILIGAGLVLYGGFVAREQ